MLATERKKGAPKRFTPLFNDAFLRIFGSADPEPVTKPMLNAILRLAGLDEIDRMERITSDTALPGGVECRTPRLDVVVLCDDGRLIDLESERRKVDVESKSMFYAAKLLVENTSKGGDGTYDDVPQVVVVVLLEGTELFPGEEQLVSVSRMSWNVGGRQVGGPDNIATRF